MSGFKVGIHGVPLPTASLVTTEHLARVRAAGAETVGLYMDEAERADPASWAPRLRELLEESGTECAYLAGPAAQLLQQDDALRCAEVEAAAAGLAAVAAVGAAGIFVGPGGFAPDGPWWYHPKNHEPASRAAVARSLRELGTRADAAGVRVFVEGHQASVLESVTIMRDVLEEAGCESLGANFDPVNYLTPPQVSRFGAAVEEMADTLGDRLAAVHIKDAVVLPQLAVHLDEAPAGQGSLALEHVVATAARAGVPALVEHLTDDDADGALRHIAALAASARDRV